MWTLNQSPPETCVIRTSYSYILRRKHYLMTIPDVFFTAMLLQIERFFVILHAICLLYFW